MKLAHLVMDEHPTTTDLVDLTDLLKYRVSRAHLAYRYSGEIARALDSALWQRRHL